VYEMVGPDGSDWMKAQPRHDLQGCGRGSPGNQGRRRGKFAASAGVRVTRQPARAGALSKKTSSQPRIHEPTGTVH
jgi:hypothetical protein